PAPPTPSPSPYPTPFRSQGIRVISNAGGVNPKACARAISALAAEQGIEIKVAVVTGDDVMPLVPHLREEGVEELQSGEPLPANLDRKSTRLNSSHVAISY